MGRAMRTDHSFRHHVVRFMLVSLTAVLAVGQSGLSAQAAWPFRLQWEQQEVPDGTFYRLCVNSQCTALNAWMDRGSWNAQLPVLPAGEHRLVVQSCTSVGCVNGMPDLMIRVLPPSSRRPPIDVINGPRIPVNRR